MKTFEKLVNKTASASLIEERIALAQDAVEFAVYQPTGYYASPELEEIYLEAASQIPVVHCEPQKKTVLHVMTQAYSSGGHTRVVQRWIDLSKADEKHDIVILNQKGEPIPQWLEDASANHHGSIVCYNEENIMKRATLLRQLAAKYEHIVLHIHMDDPTALIAFGTESFTIPIIFFNHADHMFWIGVSIADIVAELRFDNISRTRRAINNSYILGIPCAVPKLGILRDKRVLRDELGIRKDDFIIVTTGTAYKFSRIGSNSLCRQLVEIVKRVDNVSCYAIGPDMETEPWEWAYDASEGKINPLGIITNKELYYKYLLSADLYIGSYPYGSYTATMEAVQCGMPFIQLLMSRHQNFSLNISSERKELDNFCYSTKDLITKTLSLINNKGEYDDLLRKSVQWAQDYSDQDQWIKRLYELYATCPKQHTIHPFTIKRGSQAFIADNDCLIGLLHDKQNFEIKNHFLRHLSHGWMRMKGV